MIDRNLLAVCGLYCGVCGVYLAHRDNNLKFKERLATVYGCTAEELACQGCLSDVRPTFCQGCHIRNCAQTKGHEGCHQCAEFPCGYIDDFPIQVGKKVILRATPFRREAGTEKWVEEEEKRYHCPDCGTQLFRGAKTCRQCKAPVDVD